MFACFTAKSEKLFSRFTVEAKTSVFSWDETQKSVWTRFSFHSSDLLEIWRWSSKPSVQK